MLTAAGLAAFVALAVYWMGPPGVDQAAHVFGTWEFSQHGFAWWSNDWYSGRYELVSYSPLFYPLASLAGIGTLAVAGAAVLAGALSAALADRYGVAVAAAPCLMLAPTAAFNTVVSGAYPFLCGAAAAAVAALCAQRGWRAGFIVSAAVTLAFSPLALALLTAVLVGFAAAAGIRPALRRHRLEIAGLVVVLAAGAAVQELFSLGERYPYGGLDLITVVAFCVAGIALAGPRRSALDLRLALAAYLAVNAAAYAVSAPIGSNADRLFLVAGTPLLWLAARLGNRRGRWVGVVLAVSLVVQMQVFVRDLHTSWEDPATTRAFWAPAVSFLAARGDSQYRVEVVASWGHWEADYLPRAGIPIARGWFRQDDFPQNAVLYRSRLTAAAYDGWLRSVGVRFVILPDGPLDYSAHAEAALLRSGRSGLRRVARVGRLTVYELPRATPIVTGPGSPRLVSLAGGRVVFDATAAGSYLVRVRYTPYWTGAHTARGGNSMTAVDVPAAGPVALSVSP